MKKNYLLILLLMFATQLMWAQSTELFESEVQNATTFTDAGQQFTIASQALGPFRIQKSYPGTGWTGTTVDDAYIDNSGTSRAGQSCQFSVGTSSGNGFMLKSMWLYLSTSNLNHAIEGQTLTITGIRNGNIVFVGTKSSGYATSDAQNNGYTLIDMANFGGQNNASVVIDQFVIGTTTGINYVGLDAMSWQCAAPVLRITSQTNVSCNGGNNGSATVSAGSGSYTYDWTPNAPVGDNAATASGLTAGTYTVTVTTSCGLSSTVSVTLTEPGAVTATTTQTNVLCNGATTGSAGVNLSGGTAPYTYVWSNGSTAQSVCGLAAGNYSVTIKDANNCSIIKNFSITQPAALEASTSQTDVSCFGGNSGAAGVMPTGGVAPYTYLWSNGSTAQNISGLTQGNYTVTISDANNCSITRSINITQPSELTASTAQTNTTCYGTATGTATITVSGGTGSYAYLWSPSGATTETATGLAAGTHTVTVTDDSGCQIVRSYNIQDAPLLTAATSSTNVACFGAANGSATVNVTGGTGSYSYSWSPSGGTGATASNLAPGTYTVTIADANACQITKSITITQPALALTATTTATPACSGGATGSATVEAAGGTGSYSYSWSPSGGTGETANNLSAGVYTVTVTDANNCQISENVTIIETTAMTVSIQSSDITCNGAANGTATAVVNSGSGNYTYNWSNGATTQSISNIAAGTYSVTVSDLSGCTGATDSVTINEPTALNVSVTKVDANCFGDVTSASATVTGGTAPYTYAWPNGETGASATNLPQGSQVLTVTDANNCVAYIQYYISVPPQLDAYNEVLNTRDVTCHGGNDGIGDVSLTGGVPPYTFSWYPSGGTNMMATNLTAGEYQVTVTDSRGCTDIVNITINEPAAGISAVVQSTNTSCAGTTDGAATVTAAGGTGALTYTWSNGATGTTVSDLSQGEYSVTITDANGCTLTENFTIAGPAYFYTYANPTDIGCNAPGSIVPVIEGGVAPYTYQWSDGSTDAALYNITQAGSYSVMVTDSTGCTTMSEFYVGEAYGPSAEISATNILCAGSATGIAQAYGSQMNTYLWSNGATTHKITNLTAGVYSVTITAPNGCTSTLSVEVTEPDPINITVASQENNTCYGTSTGSVTINVSGGVGAYTYNWTNGNTTDTITGLAVGTYSVTVTDENGCTATLPVVITQPAAIANDNCAGAQQVFVGVTGGTTSCATPSVVAEVSCTQGSVYDAWYKFNTGANTQFVLGADAGFAVYSGTCGTLTEVACSVSGTTQTLNGLSANSTYFIRVFSLTEDGRGSFTLNLTIPCTAPTGLTEVNDSSSATLSWSPATALPSGGYEYEVRTSGNAGSGNTGLAASGTASSLSQIVSSLTANTNYTAYVRSACGEGVYSDWTGGVSFFTGFCTPAPTSGSGIVNVTFNNINNTTAAAGNYADYTALSGDALRTAPVTVSVAFGSTSFGKIWVDWNNDLDFNDEGELVYAGTSAAAAITVQFSIPEYALTGPHRMRIGGGATENYTACHNGAGASFEDYTINITTVGPAHVADNQCNGTVTTFDAGIFSSFVQGATAYRFRVTSASGTQVIETGNPYFRLNMLNSYNYGISYTVDVSVMVSGNWTDYGYPCTVMATVPSTRLVNCGATVSNFTTGIYANIVNQATTYRFNIASAEGMFTLDRPVPYFTLNMLPVYNYGTVYTVTVDAFVNGSWSGYGPACTVTVQSQLPSTQLRPADCGTTVASFSTGIYASLVTMAQTYTFTVTSVYGTEVLVRPTAYFTLNMLANYDYNVTYSVTVTASAPGAATSAPGASCTVTSPAMPPLTSLRSADCGATIATRNTVIYANIVPAAVTYRFRLTSANTGVRILDRPTGNFRLNMLTGIIAGETLLVEVMTISANGSQSGYGNACNIALSASATRPANATAEAPKVNVKGYPNPYVDSFSIELSSDSSENVGVMIYDMAGKLVEQHNVAPMELPELRLGSQLAAGVYNLVVTQGETIKTLHVVKNNQ